MQEPWALPCWRRRKWSRNEILGIFTGDIYEAHLAACAMADYIYGVEVEEPADVVIASCGGYPKDINVYQAHKTLSNAMEALKRAGGSSFWPAALKELIRKFMSGGPSKYFRIVYL